MNKQSLLEWEAKHNAIKQTIDGFWSCFRKWRKEEKDDYHKTFYGKLYEEFISVHERAIYLKYTFSLEEAVIFCSVYIFYLEESIGTYDIEFTLDGQIADDYLDFGDVLLKDRILKIKHNLRIARNALKEGVEIRTISNITEIDSKYIQILKEKYC
ncbi:hypothetical protein [Paenibacillus sp. OV219]|uniref:hypothetical protein n=1 Tax=Paenibacillus sp. OV219 TaxID=1884377 RepID=UPI0008B01DB8|nr:hypothetical protein [Paenibacillus sp. OV219]SEM50839.1 hypothetical protein SAMN05518847_10122 [Paenibacillus sp. OV219]